ncbi:MAG TPA: hypothetical protein VFC71_06285 [Candidatus Polarisedimenticolia bacterium]|nr:hypothetical protein [Candidatus Polarisedimenticolia bacterium]
MAGSADPLGDDALDFWLGDWDVSWDTSVGRGVGRNRLTKVVGRRGVLERFEGVGPRGRRLHGMSLSIRDTADGRWRQTWIDSSGSYLDLVGAEVDRRISFEREAVEDGKPVRYRMTWTDVTDDSLTWHWQRTSDHGATWSDLWTIDYRRRPVPPRAATTRAGAARGTRRSAR